mgnify:CR=1 FL=1
MHSVATSLAVLPLMLCFVVGTAQACVKTDVLDAANEGQRISLEQLRDDCHEGLRLLRAGRAADALPLLERAAKEPESLTRDLRLPLAEALYGAGVSAERALVAWESVDSPMELVNARRMELVERLPMGRAAVLLAAEPDRSAAMLLKMRAARDAHSSLAVSTSPQIAGRIGVLVPLSGKLATFGQQVVRGLHMGLDDDTTLFVRDSANKDRSLESTARELEALGVTAIVGPISRTKSRSMARVANDLGVPLIRLSVEDPGSEPSPWVFRAFLSRRSQSRAQILHAKRKGARTFALLHVDSPFGHALRDVFQAEATRAGMSIVAVEAYPSDTTNWTPVIKQLQAHSFDGLYLADGPQNAGSLLRFLARADIWGTREKAVKKTADSDLRYVHMLGPSEWKRPSVISEAGRYLRGLVLPVEWSGNTDPSTAEFTRRFRQSYATLPELFDAVGYDAIRILQAVRSATRQGLAEALRRETGFDGQLGAVRFDDTGEPNRTVRLYRASSKGFVLMKTDAQK